MRCCYSRNAGQKNSIGMPEVFISTPWDLSLQGLSHLFALFATTAAHHPLTQHLTVSSLTVPSHTIPSVTVTISTIPSLTVPSHTVSSLSPHTLSLHLLFLHAPSLRHPLTHRPSLLSLSPHAPSPCSLSPCHPLTHHLLHHCHFHFLSVSLWSLHSVPSLLIAPPWACHSSWPCCLSLHTLLLPRGRLTATTGKFPPSFRLRFSYSGCLLLWSLPPRSAYGCHNGCCVSLRPWWPSHWMTPWSQPCSLSHSTPHLRAVSLHQLLMAPAPSAVPSSPGCQLYPSLLSPPHSSSLWQNRPQAPKGEQRQVVLQSWSAKSVRRRQQRGLCPVYTCKGGMPLPELGLILPCSPQNGKITQCIHFLLLRVFMGAQWTLSEYKHRQMGTGLLPSVSQPTSGQHEAGGPLEGREIDCKFLPGCEGEASCKTEAR